MTPYLPLQETASRITPLIALRKGLASQDNPQMGDTFPYERHLEATGPKQDSCKPL
jgi:hypothetical protein